MASLVTSYLNKLFPKHQARALMVGLDASGRTTWLYQAKLGEIVTTIPTIGFNVETVDYKGKELTFWDVGGCDKIRPLWRHYFTNTDVLMMFVDSHDVERMNEARDELNRMLNEEELRDAIVLMVASKQDLPGSLSAAEVEARLNLAEAARGRVFKCMPGSCKDPQLICDCLAWMSAAIDTRKQGANRAPPSAQRPPAAAPTADPQQPSEDILTRWLAVEDEPDDAFLRRLEDCTLDAWDHRTHLRLAFLYMSLHGRREGMARIFASIKRFIETSPVTKRKTGTTYHETLTYFWVHMVHYALASTKSPVPGSPLDFKTFLLLNPVLTNGGLYLHYYTKDAIMGDPHARTQVKLPDKRPLPSILTDLTHLSIAARVKDASPSSAPHAPPAAQQSDAEFLAALRARSLDRWNHECLLRAIYCHIRQRGRRRGAALALAELEALQGQEGFHLTITYFWINMLTYALAHDYSKQLLEDRQQQQQPAAADSSNSSGVSNSSSSIDGSSSAAAGGDMAGPGPKGQETNGANRGAIAAQSTQHDKHAATVGMVSQDPPALALPGWHALLASKGYTAERVREMVVNERMYLAHYSAKRVYSDEAARAFLPPDRKPLPSVLPGGAR